MIQVLVAIANGSEELESVTVVDLLRRAGAHVTVASVESNTRVTASRHVKIEADCTVEQLPEQTWDVIVLPGGMPGAERLGANPALMTLVNQQLLDQRWVAALCAAPAVVLGRHHLLKNISATCYPTFQQELATQAKEVRRERVVIDQKVVTSQGPGTAIEFTLTLIELIFGHNKRNEIAAQILY